MEIGQIAEGIVNQGAGLAMAFLWILYMQKLVKEAREDEREVAKYYRDCQRDLIHKREIEDTR